MVDPLKIEVVSPEKVLYSGAADMVITRTQDGGEIAFQAGHAAFLGVLVENHTRIFATDGTLKNLAVHRGFVEVSGNPTVVSILSDTAELSEDIDVERAKAALERHDRTIRDEDLESEITDALSGRARALARLEAAGYEVPKIA
jgi:F-type H+-transporting ATPase subunit epsilon